MVKKADNRAGILRVAVLAVIVLTVAAIVAVRYNEKKVQPSVETIQTLAECLSSKGATMYGASWCSHCAKQKKDFGDSFTKIKYVECAVPGDPRELTKECSDANIQSFPTWVFADGSRQEGEMSFKDLADRVGCPWSE